MNQNDLASLEPEMDSVKGPEIPKYACRRCGSLKLRSNFDTFQVFRAEGDKIIHIGSDFLASGLWGLYSYECDEEIQVESLGSVKIE